MNILAEVPIDEIEFDHWDAESRPVRHMSAKRSKRSKSGKNGKSAVGSDLKIGSRRLPSNYEARIAERGNIRSELIPQVSNVLDKIRNAPDEDDLTSDGEHIIPGKRAVAKEYASWVIASVKYVNSGGEMNLSADNIVEIENPAIEAPTTPEGKMFAHKYSVNTVEATSASEARELLLDDVSKAVETWQEYLACVPADEIATVSQRLSKDSLDDSPEGEDMIWSARQEVITKDILAMSRE